MMKCLIMLFMKKFDENRSTDISDLIENEEKEQ